MGQIKFYEEVVEEENDDDGDDDDGDDDDGDDDGDEEPEIVRDSWIDFGEPNIANIRDGSEVAKMNMIEEDFYWSSYNTAIAIGDIDTNAYLYGPTEGWDYGVFISNNAVYSVIDSGTRVLNISRIYYESLIRSIFEYAGIEEWFFDEEPYTSCENIPNMPSLYFQLDQKWIEARP